jgi:hypothetical protein
MSKGDALGDSGPGADLDEIRAELEAEIDRTSLRAVARAVGMSPSGLTKVLAGGRPYRQTLSRLRSWHVRQITDGSRTAEDVALETLLQRIPEHRRDGARQRILTILETSGSAG